MLRLAVPRSVAVLRVASHVRPAAVSARISLQQVRYEHSKPPQELADLRRDWDAKVITYEELKPKTTQPSPDKYLVDVREPNEVMQGSIPSAVNIPLSQLSGALHLSRDAFKEKFGFEKPRPTQEVTFYCRSGVRSATAADVAKRNGFTNVLNYKGSWLEWTEREGKKSAA